MKTNPAFADIKFEPPGPGAWELERAHFTRPTTRFGARALMNGMPRGFAEGAARYGLLISHPKPVSVHGFMYSQIVAYGAPPGGGSGPPPHFVLWLMSRLHPGMRARIALCQRAFDEKLWRTELAEWDRVDKPQAIEKHLALQEVDPATLDASALRNHVQRSFRHMEDMVALHHRYNVTASMPSGDYLAHVLEWTDASAADALSLLRGTSPLARGVARDELDALVAALRTSAEARAALAQRGDAQGVLDTLSAMPGDVGKAARGYLDVVRFRSMGYDISDKTSGELPDMQVRALRASLDEGRGPDALAARDAKERELRARVPQAHRAHFDELLGEARLVNRLRDERGIYGDSWGTGLARRAVLEVGRRLVEAGKIDDREHAVDLDLEEMLTMLADGTGPSAAELAKRALFRATMTLDHVPPWLGRPPSGPPPADALPAAARRAMKAMAALIGAMSHEHEGKTTETHVEGLSINDGVYEGTARVVLDPADFGRIQQGDVLVTRSTSAYFNVVLPLLGAIVTDRGGQLCHAAIVAREYGIPGIVGTKEATVRIPDGARVRVDGGRGQVTILSGSAEARS